MTIPSSTRLNSSSERLRSGLARPGVRSLILVFILGLALGWLVLGWVFFPVQWTSVYPDDLHPDVQYDYLQMVADSYSVDQDLVKAAERLAYWVPEQLGPIIYDQATLLEESGQTAAAERMRRLGERLLLSPEGTLAGRPRVETQPTTTIAASGLTIYFLLGAAVLVLFVLIIALRALGVDVFRFRRRAPGKSSEADYDDLDTDDEDIEDAEWAEPQVVPARSASATAVVTPVRPEPPRPMAPAVAPQETPTPASETAAEPVAAAATGSTGWIGAPVVAVFEGNPDYNEIFDIEEGDHYYGEYGLGVGQADAEMGTRALVLEVWLFDKSEIRTVSCSLLPPVAYDDEDAQQRLAGEGDKIVRLDRGATFRLETDRLALDGNVQRVDFGAPLPNGDVPITYAKIELRGGAIH